MTTIIPRDYQIECVNSIFRYFSEHDGNPVCALPTGTGKSVVISMFLWQVFQWWPTQKVMVLTHVKELIQQNYLNLMTFWPSAPAGVNSAGLGQRDIHNNIIFAGIASVAKYAAQFGHVDLVIIDEAHLVGTKDTTMYQKFLGGLKAINPKLKVIGFTATPWRLGQGHITEEGGLFTDVCFDITGLDAFNRLIAEGYLAPLIPRQTKTYLDVDGVHIRGGDFIQSELQHAVNREEITVQALREALEGAQDRKHWLIFASGVEHANNVADILTSLGEPCYAIHSKLSNDQRDKYIAAFKRGEVRAVVNNNVLTTGFDFPAIDFILMLRPTVSTALWVQMLGRGTRPSPATGKQNCLVFDYAGNTRRLGPINDPMVPRRKGGKAGSAPIKLCDACSTLNHASVRFCISCGAEFHFETKLKAEASTQDLIKGEQPIVEVFKVDHITYREHQKLGRPPSIRVTYYCGYQSFTEYVCLEHEGYALRKAQQWWRQRSTIPPPRTTAEGLFLIEQVASATHLRVWVNKQYPEILSHCFDGTAFGTQAVSDSLEGPSVEVVNRETRHNKTDPAPAGDIEDDDIPF